LCDLDQSPVTATRIGIRFLNRTSLGFAPRLLCTVICGYQTHTCTYVPLSQMKRPTPASLQTMKDPN